jgi:2-acylglycerol O-acyltransferase 2
MENNTPLVPVYVFGASDYYFTSGLGHRFRLWLVEKLGISILLAWGTAGPLGCPLPVPTTIVMGSPMLFVANTAGAPSADEVEAAHGKFCRALEELFDKYKRELGYGDRKLEIE